MDAKKPSLVARLKDENQRLMAEIRTKEGELRLFRDKVKSYDLQAAEKDGLIERLHVVIQDRKKDIVMFRAKYLMVLELYCAQNRLDVKDLHPVMEFKGGQARISDLMELKTTR